MHFTTAQGKPVRLKMLKMVQEPPRADQGPGFVVTAGTEEKGRVSDLITSAARMVFGMDAAWASKSARRRVPSVPSVFRDQESGRIRVVYKEIVVRFHKKCRAAMRKKILKKYGFDVRKRNRFVREQFVVYHPRRKRVGADLLDVANDWADMEEVAFAAPNFVSEYKRFAVSRPSRDQ